MKNISSSSASIFIAKHHIYLVWIPFFLSPFFWPNTVINAISVNVLCFATALFATAWSWEANTKETIKNLDLAPWVFLFLCITPTFFLLLQQNLRSPWHAFQGILYLTAAWLIYQTSKETASKMLASKAFMILITATAYLYITYSLLQAWDLRFWAGERLFPIWTTNAMSFPGPLMQRNLEGLFLTLTTVILMFHAVKECRSYMFVIASLPMMGVLLTSSRSSIALLIVVICVFAFIHRSKTSFLTGLLATFITAVILTLIVNNIGIIGVSNIETNPFSRFETGGINERLAIWAMAIQLSLEHPIFGIGWQNMPAYGVDMGLSISQKYPSLSTAISSLNVGGHLWAHNLILQFTMSAGILGLGAISMLIITLYSRTKYYWHNIENHEPKSLANLLALVIFLHGMVSVSTMHPFFMVLFAFFLAAGKPENKSFH